MPPKSKKQQQAAGIAYAAKKQGKKPPGTGPAAQMAGSMNTTQLKEFATKTKGGYKKKK
jgi:proline racemase